MELKWDMDINGGKKLLNKFKIFKDNYKEIRDEALANGFEKFQRHPLCDENIYYALNTGDNPGLTLCVGGDVIEENTKLYPKLWKLYNELDLKNKVSIGIVCLTTNSKINPHTDPENCYRYHLCLQSEKDTSNIENCWERNTKSENFINEGEEVILLPHKFEHNGFNNSDNVFRMNIMIDILKEENNLGLEHYRKYFNGNGWHDGTEYRFQYKWWENNV